MTEKYIISGDRICPYLVFSNSHDGANAINAAMTPVRVVCNNTLNLALSTAKRVWSCNHTGNMQFKLEDAKETLFRAQDYMDKLGKTIDRLNRIRLDRGEVNKLVEQILPIPEDASAVQEKNVEKQREDMRIRFFLAPDLNHLESNGYRFVNAVSDFATHAKPLRETKNYQEN